MAEASESPPASSSARNPDDVRGARFQLGAFALAHVRRTSALNSTPGTIVPGIELGVGFRLDDAWEIDASARGAYFADPGMSVGQETRFAAIGGRLRRFTHPASSATPFFDGGIDVVALAIDGAYGLGAVAHLGAGIELLHNQPHHRFRIGLGVDIPSFALTYPHVSLDTADWFSMDRPLYVIPVTLAANWTF